MLGKHSTNYWAIPTPSVLFLKDVYLLVLAPPAEKSLKSCFSFDLYYSVLYTLIRRLQFFTELGKEDERGFVLGFGLITQSTCVIVLLALMLCLFQGTHRVFCKQGVQTWLCKKLLLQKVIMKSYFYTQGWVSLGQWKLTCWTLMVPVWEWWKP